MNKDFKKRIISDVEMKRNFFLTLRNDSSEGVLIFNKTQHHTWALSVGDEEEDLYNAVLAWDLPEEYKSADDIIAVIEDFEKRSNYRVISTGNSIEKEQER